MRATFVPTTASNISRTLSKRAHRPAGPAPSSAADQQPLDEKLIVSYATPP